MKIFNSFIQSAKATFCAITLLGLGILSSSEVQAQGPQPTGSSCADAMPFCTGTTYTFPNIAGGPSAPAGPNYGCCLTQPSAVWYYFKIDNPGTLQITVNQSNAVTGAATDVDFTLWGPFASLAAGCTSISGGIAPIQASYNAGGVPETIGLGLPGGGTGGGICGTTPPAALNGQYYIVMFTNFTPQPGILTFSQTAGTATTDCSILTCGVTLTSNSPICQNDTLKLFLDNSNEPEYTYTYNWTGPNGYTSTQKQPVIANLAPGTYTYQVEAVAHLANNEFDTCIEEIEVYVNPSFADTLVEYICAGDSFPWYDQHLSVAGNYDTLFYTAHGCDSFVRTVLHVIPRPQQINMLDTIIACQYDSVAIESNTLPYTLTYTYDWQPSTNLNVSDQPNVWFSADASRRYVLTVTNTQENVSCTLKDTIDIIVNPGDFLQVPITDTGICPGDTVQLFAQGAASYKWSPAKYLSSDSIANPIARTETSTLYTLIGTSDKGCRDTQTVMITVHPAAVLELPDFVNLYPGEVYQMQPQTNAVYFYWFPDAGLNSPNISNPKMNPNVDTRYFVTARTEFGCEYQDSVDVWVKETVMNTPNAFNPNTTQFKADIRGMASLELFEVYNRWGQKVFETKDINQGWDGLLKGAPQPMGVYVYMIQATTVEGKPFKKTGNVTLVR